MSALEDNVVQAGLLGKALDAAWGRLCKPIDFSELPTITGGEERSTRCRAAGRCICSNDKSGEGPKLFLARNAFYGKLKATCPPKSRNRRELLVYGFIVVRLEGATSPRLIGAAFGPQPHPIDVRWLHLGLAYLNPFRMTFMELKQVHMDDGQFCGDMQVFVQTTHRYLTEYAAIGLLNLELHWTASWYRLDVSTRPLGTVLPNAVPVVPLEEAHPHQPFWPPRKPSGNKVKGNSISMPVMTAATAEDLLEDQGVGDAEEAEELAITAGIDEDVLELMVTPARATRRATTLILKARKVAQKRQH